MPRLLDLENHFDPLPAIMTRKGRLERDTKNYFDTTGKDPFDWPKEHFTYGPGRDVVPANRYYSNAIVDEIYEWIDANATGRWHWYECVVNHGHSLTIDLWFENPNDIKTFEARWSTHFQLSIWEKKARGIK